MSVVRNTFAYLFRLSCVQSREETLKKITARFILWSKSTLILG